MNAMIPGGLVVTVGGDGNVVVAKLASLSYINMAGKLIPTIWKFRLMTSEDHHLFHGLLRVFSRLALEVNKSKSLLLAASRLPLQQIHPNKKR